MSAQLLCLNAQYVVHNVELQQLLLLKQSFSTGLLLLWLAPHEMSPLHSG